jgi:tetratricopeptide (TPR) repeat protein
MWGQSGRLYPYFFFDGFTNEAVDMDWTVISMENPYISVSVLPQVGGKIWYASEKSTNNEFVYKNNVLKFRQIALRGPWTSGGIEFNFGVVGHTPATATEVDYLTRKNSDGSVSCIVGTLDLPSRTRWSVNITVPKDKAFFQTKPFWFNPSAINQSYYCWMNSAVSAREDLQNIFPGNWQIGHDYSKNLQPWPVNSKGRDVSWYKNNNFGPSKSYFTVGKYENFFGGYWHDLDFGYGHWASYDDMPGQKFFLWALSTEGAIWEELLTDTDGQYIEPQAGRLLNQNDHEFFTPYTADTWQEIWFPYKNTGPMVKATPHAVLSANQQKNSIEIAVCPLQRLDDDLTIIANGKQIHDERLKLRPMQVYTQKLPDALASDRYEVRIGEKLFWTNASQNNDLSRPFSFHESTENTTEELFLSAQRYEKSRQYQIALEKYLQCLKQQPFHMRALCRAAELYYRKTDYDLALKYVTKALEQDMYDPAANYIYAVISRKFGNIIDAKEAFGWAARSLEYRSAAYCQLAEIFLMESNYKLALEYADRSLNFNCYNINALQLKAIAYRKNQQIKQAERILDRIFELEPLNHFTRFECYLLRPGKKYLNKFQSMIRNEFPEETYLELAVYYASLGQNDQAIKILELCPLYPTTNYWLAYLLKDSSEKSKKYLDIAASLSAEHVFPFRHESIPIFQWAITHNPTDWKAKYYLSLIHWSKGNVEQARQLLENSSSPDFAPFYITRAHINKPIDQDEALTDLKNAVKIEPDSWRTWHYLIMYYSELKMHEESLKLAENAIKKFPDQNIILLDYIRTLANNKLWKKAIDRLEQTSTLPFEGAREIHNIFVECNIQLALDSILQTDFSSAIEFLENSKRYPEQLGTGKPFEPDYRRQDYLIALCYEKIGDKTSAVNKMRLVYDYTITHWDNQNANQYFGALSLKYFGEKEKAEKIIYKQKPPKRIIEIIDILTKDDSEQISCGTGSWDSDTLGNHRIVINVTQASDAAAVHIPWRRRAINPENKKVILIDAQTNQQINNILHGEVTREFGDFVFQPSSGPGLYYLYYMPYILKGTHYPQVTYPQTEKTYKDQWLEQNELTVPLTNESFKTLPRAKASQIQSIDEFNSFYPMEVIATSEETQKLLQEESSEDYLLFPEDRKYPIRMTDDLPVKWIEKGPTEEFRGIDFTGLAGPLDSRIETTALSCFNKSGINWDGEKLHKMCPVEKGKIRPLWFGIQIPQQAEPGIYKGWITIRAVNLSTSKRINLILEVKDKILADAGDSEPWRHSRLRWLDSEIANDDEVVEPFTRLEIEDDTIRCLGRSLTIGQQGLPADISSFFLSSVTGIGDDKLPILASPIRIVVEDAAGKDIVWESQPVEIVKKNAGIISWRCLNKSQSISMECNAEMEFDGFAGFVLKLSTSKPVRVNDIRLEIPIKKEVAEYMMGMGLKGGFCPKSYQWKWDKSKNQDAAWIGKVNAGLYFSLRAENYSRPLNTNFYLLKPLNMPPSWYNQGKGGCDFRQVDDDKYMVTVYSGNRSILSEEELYFNFNLLLTPFKPLDTNGQWSTRFFHSYSPIDDIAATGANTINNHHANDANPYINYPFIHTNQMKAYVDAAHEKGMKVKIYYTVRELANRAAELFALNSLDHEIFSDGAGGGWCWLQEHLGDGYIPGWFVTRYQDAAIINSGVSRWHNYYLEGLDWLMKNIGIDGIYIDDVAFDRTIMKRLRKIMDRNCEGALIDLHSANQYNIRDGFVNSAVLYLEHFPYINRLWFGEYFDYNSEPEYWLTEVSGIPFGLMGEMLQDNGNPWRGMVYGMTGRMPRTEMPQRLWRIWDEFGIHDSEMTGYWSDACPVRTDNEQVLATAYVKKNKTMIAIASWATETVKCRLSIDWTRLGLSAETAKLTAPAIKGFQGSAIFSPDEGLPLEPGKGWLLFLSN